MKNIYKYHLEFVKIKYLLNVLCCILIISLFCNFIKKKYLQKLLWIHDGFIINLSIYLILHFFFWIVKKSKNM